MPRRFLARDDEDPAAYRANAPGGVPVGAGGGGAGFFLAGATALATGGTGALANEC